MDATKTAKLEAALEARDIRIAELEARLLRYERPAPVAKIDGPFAAPTPEQRRLLLDAVLRVYPVLIGGASGPGAEFRREFADAFAFVSTLRRTPGVMDKRSNFFWVDAGAEIMKASFRAPAFAAAVVAAGDVDFMAMDRWPHEYGYGLMVGTRTGTRPATNAWLNVIQGRLRAPQALRPYPTTHPTGMVRVLG